MKRLNFTRATLILVACIFLTLPSYAQILAEVTDNTCTSATQCQGQSGQGCNSTTFTLSTAHTIDLCATIQCTTPGCQYCLSVAYIYKQVGGAAIACIHSDCDTGCTGECTGNVTLESGDYILYCCKLDCPDDDCVHCGTGCTAKATVSVFPEP